MNRPDHVHRRAFIGFPHNWDKMSEAEKEEMFLAMADSMIEQLANPDVHRHSEQPADR